MSYFLRDIKPGLFLPVMLYLGIISIMTLSALFLNAKRNIILIGAVLFMISDTIIAINTDPAAPIFNIAQYGVVEDIFDLVPVLTEKLEEI